MVISGINFSNQPQKGKKKFLGQLKKSALSIKYQCP